MAKPQIDASQLLAASSARFSRLPKALTAKFVKELFASLLEEIEARRVGATTIRKVLGPTQDRVVYSFLCFRTQPPVTFLKVGALRELRYGFVLLVERSGHLAVFQRGASGLDSLLQKVSKSIPRHELTHAWGKVARYQKLGTRRMSIAQQELSGASYEADDLETSLPPSVASRSIPQSIRMNVGDEGTIAITPSTGRVQKAGEKSGLPDLLDFVDELLAQLGAKNPSPFLNAFPSPLQLDELPEGIKPTGLLFDAARLQNYMLQPETECTLKHAQDEASEIWQRLAPVMDLKEDPIDEDKWIVEEKGHARARLRRLTSSFGISADLAKGWTLERADGTKGALDAWLRQEEAFSVSFSDPEYFYTRGSLYRRAGFVAEAQFVLGLLQVQVELDGAKSEKGPTSKYDLNTQAFDNKSIFHVVENVMAGGLAYLCCSDLNDEWADYFGIDGDRFTFYHCKDGDPTAGASDFQIVVAQALKNLSRVKFQPIVIEDKLKKFRDDIYWTTTTRIPRLVKAGGWPAMIAAAKTLAGNPRAIWRVALVVTALSRSGFVTEMQRAQPRPHFIQLVWLLSAFASNCKDRDATPLIYCRT